MFEITKMPLEEIIIDWEYEQMNIYDEWFYSLTSEEIEEMTGMQIGNQSFQDYHLETLSEWNKLSDDQKQLIWFNVNNEL